MRHIRKLPKLKTRLSFFEKIKLAKKGNEDKAKKFTTVIVDGKEYELPSFVIHEISKFEFTRDFIFNNYKIVLDCKNIDKPILNCSRIDSCTKKSCKYCIRGFSEIITIINNLIDNALASLLLFNADKINERNNLIIKISQTDIAKQEHIKVMLRTKLDNVVAELHKEKIEINALIVNLLNAKIRFIDNIELTIKSYFDYCLNRINCYLENASKTLPSPSSDILKLCNSSLLEFYALERENAKTKKATYEKQGDFLYKTALASAIARVEIAARGVSVDTDSANVDYKKEWVTKKEWDAFASAIAIAQDAMSRVNTEQEVNDEADALKVATDIFNAAKKYGTSVDTIMLIKTIEFAEKEKTGVFVSDAAEKIDYKNLWVTQDEWDLFSMAITIARNKIKVVVSDQQVIDAIRTLKKSISIFVSEKKKGVFVNKSALEGIIIKAEQSMENIEINTARENVDYKKQWVKQDVIDVFVAAITKAKNDLTTASTDEQVSRAVKAVDDAVNVFNSNKINGGYVNKTALIAIIRDAENEKESISISVDGSDVYYKKIWVPQDEYSSFENAIKKANFGLKNGTKTDEEVVIATNKLKEGIARFVKSKKNGTFVDKSVIIKAIEDAETLKNNIIIDTEKKNVDNKLHWVTQMEYDSFITAIESTKKKASSATNDEEVIDATDALHKAVTIFNNCKKKGTYVDKTKLEEAIIIAENSKIGILIEDDASNVDYKKEWATQKNIDILTNSIKSAQNSLKRNITDEQVSKETKCLLKAVERFNNVKQKGTFKDAVKNEILSDIRNSEAAEDTIVPLREELIHDVEKE